MSSSFPAYPKNFIWGTATASYQIEGAVREDGRGESIWDTFSRIPGNVLHGDTGDVACDHYHRWKGDIGLMTELGIKAYRFSIAWPRIQPLGSGPVNIKGLDFYDRLVDGLLEANIDPFVTLYHWDLPQALQDKGGWANRDMIERFAEYTDIVTRRLGDRVKNWITHNEPWVIAVLGNWMGIHAPGIKHGPVFEVAHHLLVSHGEAVPVVRANSAGAKVGITVNLYPCYSVTDSEADKAAAVRQDAFANRWFLDPLFGKGYPKDLLEMFADHVPAFPAEDFAKMSVPTDFMGINFYSRVYVRDNPQHDPPLCGEAVRTDNEYTAMDWEVYPQGLYDLLTRIHKDYGDIPLYITENGAAYDDVVTPDGQIHDDRRKNYLETHFAAARRAIADGVPLHGYLVWSMMDNFEWALGYDKRFGIIYVNYETQERTLKDSALYFKEVVAETYS